MFLDESGDGQKKVGSEKGKGCFIIRDKYWVKHPYSYNYVCC